VNDYFKKIKSGSHSNSGTSVTSLKVLSSDYVYF